MNNSSHVDKYLIIVEQLLYVKSITKQVKLGLKDFNQDIIKHYKEYL